MHVLSYILFSMWSCSICAASYQTKHEATRHTQHHNISQVAQVMCIPSSTIAPMASPIPPVEIDTYEDEVTSDLNGVMNITRQNRVKIASVTTHIPACEATTDATTHLSPLKKQKLTVLKKNCTTNMIARACKLSH